MSRKEGTDAEDGKAYAVMDSRVSNAVDSNSLGATTKYNIGNKTFIVEPHFKESGEETIGTILIKMMKSESAKA